MLRFAQMRRFKLGNPLLQHARRYLATETQITLGSSPQFIAEEQRQTGVSTNEPELTDEEQKERYEQFLGEKEIEGPLRPQLRVNVDQDHGLWAFFRREQGEDGQETHQTVKGYLPGQVLSGRSWRAYELRRKSFKDLHTLWYIILRERNLLATQRAEAIRLGIQPRVLEGVELDKKCRKTMARIKQILNERRLAYENAVELRCQQEQSTSETAIGQPVIDSKSVTRGRRDRRRLKIEQHEVVPNLIPTTQ